MNSISFSPNSRRLASGSENGTTKIWDLPTRVFHWLLVGLVIAAYVTAELGELEWHERCGLSILTLVVARIVWGFIGLLVIGPLLGGVSLLTAGIIIALMAVPMIVSISEDSLRAGISESGRALLSKPFRRSELLQAIRAELDRSTRAASEVAVARRVRATSSKPSAFASPRILRRVS